MQEVGHGVPSSLIEKHAEFHHCFFFLPQKTKDHLRLSDGCNVRGYFGKGGEDLGSCRGVQAEMFKMSKRRLSFMAQALGQDADLFKAHLTNPVATHLLLHYWPTDDYNTQIGVGEHTDYGLLTILKQDSVGGLQVLNAKDSTWVHAAPIEGAFVVNVGDMLQRWTGNRFKSTVHRVVNTSNTDAIFFGTKYGQYDSARWSVQCTRFGWL